MYSQLSREERSSGFSGPCLVFGTTVRSGQNRRSCKVKKYRIPVWWAGLTTPPGQRVGVAYSEGVEEDLCQGLRLFPFFCLE